MTNQKLLGKFLIIWQRKLHIPKKFRQEDTNKLIALIKGFPFATLIGSNESGAQVMHLPLLIKNEDGQSYSLNGHIAKVNPFWQQIKQGNKELRCFMDPIVIFPPIITQQN